MKSTDGLHFTGIIPARYASTRFPGKPLVTIGDKPMIRMVYEQASRSLDVVYVATDDERIYDAVSGFGGRVIMTSPHHQSGTDRCAEAVETIEARSGARVDVVVNIQGDEPFIRPEQIDSILACFSEPAVGIATLIRKAKPGEDIFNPNQPKVIIDISGNAIYFSRAAIPFQRDSDKSDWPKQHTYFKHLGMYAYRKETLKAITLLPRSSLEIAESLEQNRWIENGYKIRTAITTWESISIDTPDDLEKARIFFHGIE
jgi:3-deoxy-manno-octulosonate cytidylyltransferase (CMP-KDO synthetase)